MASPERVLRDCLGRFGTGVTVVTTRHGGTVHGATVNAFTSVSLDPPLVMVSLDRRSRMCGLLADATFGVNILGAEQRDLALCFAGLAGTRPVDVAWEPAALAPRLAGCPAYLACTPWAAYDGGDHVLYVGEVREFDVEPGEPLLFHGGRFHELVGPSRRTAWSGSLDDPTGGAWAAGAPLLSPSAH
ncbi:flavin reductase family protein [Streptacidiphilus anmyonensis]|uniref:flavin reductase family protein n=1 Tax=Streptacidiphilus anmyonensis TaxID=405782 RepID=UPI0005AB744B|nr:flavin reductase family protein [Streptacidiphilus anmyonensis]